MGAPRSIDHDAVRRLRADGLSFLKIAKALGCSEEGAREVLAKDGVLASPWTDDRVVILREMWGKGPSASQIAKRLGGVSRNAVIGKAKRLGLESQRAPAAPMGAKRPAKITIISNRHLAKPPVPKPVTNAPVNFQVRPYVEAAPAPVQPTSALVDVSQAKPEYRRRECNWPIGDGESMLFCCAPVHPGSMLCPSHRQIGRQPAKDKRPERGARHLSRVDGIDLQRVDERIVPLDRLFG